MNQTRLFLKPCNYLADWQLLSGQSFNISNNVGWYYIIFTRMFSEADVLKKQWVKCWLNCNGKSPNWLTTKEIITTIQISENFESTSGSEKLHSTDPFLIVSKLRVANGAKRISPRLFHSSTRITSASDHMASVLSLLWIVYSTQMFSRSSGVRCWVFGVLSAEDLE